MLCWFHSLIFFRTLLWVKLADFAKKFLQNLSFILFGVVWKGFTPLKRPRKLTLGVFQNLLSNSVNSESLSYCLLDMA